MSESMVDRILVGHSLDGNGPLTRSLQETQTSGFIRADAPHWSIEPFIPLSPNQLRDYLLGRGELNPRHLEAFRHGCDDLDNILQERSASYQSRFAAAYESVDPDADYRVPTSHPTASDLPPVDAESPPAASADDSNASSDQPSADSDLEQRVAEVKSLCDEILTVAGFRQLQTDEITRCVGVVSQFGVPLHVDLDIFRTLFVYARGDVIGSKIRRRIRRLYRREAVEVQVYQRMMVIFQLQDDDTSEEQLLASTVHLRMFKNIPKQDIDTLLPGTRVRLSGIDRVKIILPSLGGLLMSLRRIAQTVLLFAVIALHWSAILIGLLIGYVIKSVFSYFQTKHRYQLNLTRNLYFQKLDTNSGAAYHAIQLAHQQQFMEAMLAQYVVLTSDQALSTRRLRRKCERLIREAVNVEIDFQVDRALGTLVKSGSIQLKNGSWIADPIRFP